MSLSTFRKQASFTTWAWLHTLLCEGIVLIRTIYPLSTLWCKLDISRSWPTQAGRVPQFHEENKPNVRQTWTQTWGTLPSPSNWAKAQRRWETSSTTSEPPQQCWELPQKQVLPSGLVMERKISQHDHTMHLDCANQLSNQWQDQGTMPYVL